MPITDVPYTGSVTPPNGPFLTNYAPHIGIVTQLVAPENMDSPHVNGATMALFVLGVRHAYLAFPTLKTNMPMTLMWALNPRLTLLTWKSVNN